MYNHNMPFFALIGVTCCTRYVYYIERHFFLHMYLLGGAAAARVCVCVCVWLEPKLVMVVIIIIIITNVQERI